MNTEVAGSTLPGMDETATLGGSVSCRPMAEGNS